MRGEQRGAVRPRAALALSTQSLSICSLRVDECSTRAIPARHQREWPRVEDRERDARLTHSRFGALYQRVRGAAGRRPFVEVWRAYHLESAQIARYTC